MVRAESYFCSRYSHLKKDLVWYAYMLTADGWLDTKYDGLKGQVTAALENDRTSFFTVVAISPFRPSLLSMNPKFSCQHIGILQPTGLLSTMPNVRHHAQVHIMLIVKQCADLQTPCPTRYPMLSNSSTKAQGICQQEAMLYGMQGL